MFCPVCESDYRPGITRCATCGVDLVAEHAPVRQLPSSEVEGAAAAEMVDYCGFLSLEDARQARRLLRPHGIDSEIVIRDAAGSASAQDPGEEYWLRVPARRALEATEILGHDAAADAAGDYAPGTFACSECHALVAEEETFCPHCGARFDE